MKSKIRKYVETRLTGKLNRTQWHKIRGLHSNKELKSLSISFFKNKEEKEIIMRKIQNGKVIKKERGGIGF